jgi:hypothetical protein
MLEEEVGEGFRLAEPLFEGLATFLAHQGIRVFALGEEEEADLLLAAGLGQAGLQGLPGGFATGAVAIEAEDQFRRLGEQQAQVVRGGGGTQGRHGIVDAKLGQGDDVQVALHHQQALPAGGGP